jgi:acyl-coenzyme A synthetase/AMP-(fatty) acid ligase
LPLLGLLTTAGYRYPLATWQAGGTVIQAPRDDETDEIHARVASANLLIASPQRLRVLLQNAVRDWDRRAERKVKLFGGRLPIAMRNDALVRLAENIEVSYGSTETGSIANGPAADIERHDGAVGYALPGVTIELVDAEDKPVPTGSEGIVRLRTPQMITDYVFALQKEGDASALRDGWFYPGDLGVLAEDGLLAITGRQDETVNCAGVKLPALTFEERINALPGVADCCLTNLKFEDRDVLAIAIMPDGKLGPKRVHKAILDARIVNWPFQFIIVREIPRNAMGKIARREFSERMTELVMRDRAKRQHEKA